MSPTSDFNFKVEPFDGSNYGLWSFKMKMLLGPKGLYSAEAAVNAIKEQQAHAVIVLSLTLSIKS